MHSIVAFSLLLLCGILSTGAAGVTSPKFRAVEIDSKIEIGYGVTVADIDGDGKPDIILADKKQIVWYKNPEWKKFVIAENLTPLDNVCVAAADIDGDGKAEIAVGAQWNPNDTVNSGAVFYLIPPADRTQKWTPVELSHEPTIHRMRWMRAHEGKYELVVAPLHGRGNKDGAGAGVKILAYKKPDDPKQPWETEVISDSLHMTHNFNILDPKSGTDGDLLVAAKEGVFEFAHSEKGWHSHQVTGNPPGETAFTGAGEVRTGRLPGGPQFIATVEPMHGNQLVFYMAATDSGKQTLWARKVIDSTLKEGHALACGDLLRAGFDQIVVGWRAKNADGKVGIKLFTPQDKKGSNWSQTAIDDNGMACEDLCLADLNGDGRLDIIAAGRATKNVKIYFNETGE
jgi:hypothetical protein